MPASSLVGLGIFSRPIREANASSRSLSSVCQNPVNLVNLVNPVNRPPPRSPRVDAFATLHLSGCLRQSFSLRSIILPCRAPCGSLIRSFQLLTLAGLLMQSFSATASIPERLPRPPGSRDTLWILGEGHSASRLCALACSLVPMGIGGEQVDQCPHGRDGHAPFSCGFKV
jgi:hypothetical protein